MASKKLSGSANRKLKSEREKVAASLSGRLGQWLIQSDTTETELERNVEAGDNV